MYTIFIQVYILSYMIMYNSTTVMVRALIYAFN